MEKSADAFRTISEVADDLDLPQHVLRFWETRFPQIRPLKRAGGRRYYRPADIALLRAIRQLLYDEGYTIKGVQRLLKEQGARGLGAANGAPPTAIEPLFDLPETPDLEGRSSPAHVGDAPSPLVTPGPSEDRDLGSRLDHDSIRDALALIEDCQAILVAARARS